MMHVARIMFVLALLPAYALCANRISNVQHDRGVIDPAKNERVTVRFQLAEPAEVALHFFDDRRLLMRTVTSAGTLASGDNQLSWDGKDQRQQPLPPEAYHYTLVAKSADGNAVEHDVTDLTGGETLEVQAISWDAGKQQLSYRLLQPARLNIRVGLREGGPLLRTLLNWVARPPGKHSQAWDGKDASGVLELASHKQLEFSAQAYALSNNTVIVGPLADRVELHSDPPAPGVERLVKKTAEPRMHDRRQHSIETRGDFPVQLQLGGQVQRNEDGIAVLSGRVPLRLDVDEIYRALALNRRMEPVFYIDGHYAFEIETGYLPITWVWDTSVVNPGKHYITANLRGYEGNFGMATLEVLVAAPASAGGKEAP